MLVLTRKQGESLNIGGMRLTIDRLHFDAATVTLEGRNIRITKRLSVCSPLVIGEVEIIFEKTCRLKARLGIKAPKEIKVWRDELCLT